MLEPILHVTASPSDSVVAEITEVVKVEVTIFDVDIGFMAFGNTDGLVVVSCKPSCHS